MTRVLDIFSGGGGSSYGAQKAGATIVCGIDMCPSAARTYQENFPDAKTIQARLEDVRLPTLRDQIGDIDLLLASPECTNHTCAKGSAPRSEESRATAMLTLRYAEAFKPRWVVMENVVHMRPWSRYEELKQGLVELGYYLREEVLDSSVFGVPQKRRRLFVVADRLRPPPDITPDEGIRRRTVKNILDRKGAWATSPLYKKGRAKPTLERAERAITQLGPDQRFLLVYYGSDGSGGWQRIDRPLRTVTTVDRFALVEPAAEGPTMRMLQVTELKKAMGFGNDFLLRTGTRRDRIKILGNGVCPPVMTRIVQQLTAD